LHSERTEKFNLGEGEATNAIMLQIFQIVFSTSISDFNPPFISDLSQNCPNSCLQQSLHHDKLVSLLTIIIIFAQNEC
jgi:hypothetical protein